MNRLHDPGYEQSAGNSNPSLKVVYWNSFMQASTRDRAAYIGALWRSELPDAMILTELPSTDVKSLQNAYETVDFEMTIENNGVSEGVAVVSPHCLKVERENPWGAVQKSTMYDSREYVRFELDAPDVGRVAIFGAHISHLHDVRVPQLALRRAKEWRELRRVLANEPKDYIFMADTNTLRSRVVRKRLGLDQSGAVLLPLLGGRTWRPEWWIGTNRPELVSIDRAVASQGIAHRTTLHVLPRLVCGVVNPSDHRAIMAVVSK